MIEWESNLEGRRNSSRPPSFRFFMKFFLYSRQRRERTPAEAIPYGHRLVQTEPIRNGKLHFKEAEVGMDIHFSLAQTRCPSTRHTE